MLNKNKKNREGLFKGITAAYLILVLHLILVAGLGLIVVFLTGIAHYMSWILIGGITLIILSAYLFHKRLEKQGQSLKNALRSPMFEGRELEISFLGGLAIMRLAKPDSKKQLEMPGPENFPRLEEPESQTINELQTLADLLDRKLITQEEFDHAKYLIFNTLPKKK
ncbi:MAG: hypothetical protein GY874_05545 [Desulfobacteraceae bacterium]|nr:hypothetical protein [Desulfobacteraceae bacterium]